VACAHGVGVTVERGRFYHEYECWVVIFLPLITGGKRKRNKKHSFVNIYKLTYDGHIGPFSDSPRNFQMRLIFFSNIHEIYNEHSDLI
jgi:hypothetical protein